MAVYFKNPANGYVTKASGGFWWLWAFLFGPFYFGFKGLYGHAALSVLAALCTFGLSLFIYPFFAKTLVIRRYQEMGWHLQRAQTVLSHEGSSAAGYMVAAFCVGFVVTAIFWVRESAERSTISASLSSTKSELVRPSSWGQPVVTSSVSLDSKRLGPELHEVALRSTIACESKNSIRRTGNVRPKSNSAGPLKAGCLEIKKGQQFRRVLDIAASGKRKALSLVLTADGKSMYVLTSDIAPAAKLAKSK